MVIHVDKALFVRVHRTLKNIQSRGQRHISFLNVFFLKVVALNYIETQGVLKAVQSFN